MRRGDRIWMAETRISGCRFMPDNVETRACHMAAIQERAQGPFVGEAAARAIDDPYALLGLGEVLRRQNVFRLRRQWRVQGYEIGAGEKSFEADFLDSEIEGAFGREERIVGDDPHVQANRARGDDRPDSAAADDAEHLAGDLDTHKTVLFPFAGLGRRIGLGNLAGEREHQCDRMFGGGDRIAKRRIHHDNAFPGRGGNIDIIDADSRAADHFQPLRPLEKFGGDLRSRANGKAVETADDAGELVLVLAEARLKIGLDAALLEDRDGGSRRMMFELNKEGRGVNRKRVRRLMRVMGIEALGPRPGTSKAAPGHRIYPYLLRGLALTEPHPVWASDITYIPMAHGFLYLVAIIDWASRAVLAGRLSNTIDSGFASK